MVQVHRIGDWQVSVSTYIMQTTKIILFLLLIFQPNYSEMQKTVRMFSKHNFYDSNDSNINKGM